jgi:hypothetical protein
MEEEGKTRNVAIPERRIERVTCRHSAQPIEHDTGDYGQSIERCGCLGGRWHNIIVDRTAPPPPVTNAERYEIKRKLGGPKGKPGQPRGNPNFKRS